VAGDLGPTSGTDTAGRDVYARLIADLEASGARYRLIEHTPEGRTGLVSALRGHALANAAKCLILLVKSGKKQTRYVLAVVPGHARLDLAAVKSLLGVSYVAFADTGKAEQITGSVSLSAGTWRLRSLPVPGCSPRPSRACGRGWCWSTCRSGCSPPGGRRPPDSGRRVPPPARQRVRGRCRARRRPAVRRRGREYPWRRRQAGRVERPQ
jgi:aminoacyl-tRNA editing protein